MWLFGPEAFTVETLLKVMKIANEPPTDENLDDQVTELLKLAVDTRKVLIKQDPKQTRVVSLPEVTPRNDANKDNTDWFVIGDLHSDYQSLCRILLKIFLRPGIKPDKVRIIFLGDYVDRGDRPIQVLRLLLRLKKDWPDHFWLLKGNHESYEILEDGTIASNVTPRDTIDLWQQYFGVEVFKALTDLFNALPVAFTQTVIRLKESLGSGSEKILYVHGGIPRKAHIRSPLNHPECGAGFIWSDPELEKDEVHNGPAKRFSFGRNDFIDFMTYHDFTILIRGHEVRKSGFDLHEVMKSSGRRMLTIFSCGGNFSDPEQSDSHYKTDILVPRFLHLQPNSPKDLPLSFEEVYRDDIQIYGNLSQYDPVYFDELISCIKGKLCESDGLGVNLYQDSNSNDLSNEYDFPDSYVRMALDIDSALLITFTIRINSVTCGGSFSLAKVDFNAGAGLIIEMIRSAYPIFGRLPKELFKQ